jgi:hypothetical protein
VIGGVGILSFVSDGLTGPENRAGTCSAPNGSPVGPASDRTPGNRLDLELGLVGLSLPFAEVASGVSKSTPASSSFELKWL